MALTLSNEAHAYTAPRRRRVSLPLLAFGLIFAGWWFAVAFVVGVDPLNVYPWGLTPKLRDVDYGPTGTPYLVDVAAKDSSIDTLLVGGSTSQAFTRGMMTKILPDAHNAFNLSYGAPRPGDRQLLVNQIALHSSAKRVILSIDWIYLMKDIGAVETDAAGNSFPSYLYDPDPFNDLHAIGLNVIRLALATMFGEPLWLPRWDYADYRSGIAQNYRQYQQPANMERLNNWINTHRETVARPTTHSCEDFPPVNTQLVPLARLLSERHISFDVFFPPFSLAGYYELLDSSYWISRVGTAFTSDYLLLQRCVARSLDGIPGVRVFAFDNEDWITGDLKNYWDPLHLFGNDAYEYMLAAIAEDSHRLTPQNVDAYVETLARRIKSYTLRNSNLGKSDGANN